jgi:hypothetical protein
MRGITCLRERITHIQLGRTGDQQEINEDLAVDQADHFDSYDCYQHGKAGYFGPLFWDTMVHYEISAQIQDARWYVRS